MIALEFIDCGFHRGKRIRETYFVAEIGQSADPAYVSLKLAESLGSLWVRVPKAVAQGLRPEHVDRALSFVMDVPTDEGTPIVRHWGEPDPDALRDVAYRLPLLRCPDVAQGALRRLGDFEHSLPEPLAGFLRRVLLDPEVGVPLLRCRASVSHHHSYVGGLLVHCTAQLSLAHEAAKGALPHEPLSWSLAELGYFLHDLGKLRSVGERTRPAYGLVSHHETITLLMLAPHLQWLATQSPELAAALTYVLEYVATPARARGPAKYLPAEIVVSLDQWSAAPHNGRGLIGLLGSKAKLPVSAANDDTWAEASPNGR